jgi:flagellar basal-body rod protein FlgB
MERIHLFDLASQKNHWLGTRQSVIASNVANANTPGYLAQDLKPFEEILNATKLQMSATSRGHMLPVGVGGANPADTAPGTTWDIVHSGNSVSLEKELMKAGEVSGAYSLNTSVVKAFHRMMLSSTRGGA